MAAKFRPLPPGADVEERAQRRHIRLRLRRQPKIRRVDNFLSQHYGAFSRTFFQKLIRARKLTVNDRTVAPSTRLQKGDVIEFDLPVLPERVIQPTPMALDVIHEDEHILVISKPPGIICHPGRKERHDTLANALVYHVHGMTEEKRNPGIVHRLDMDTSGAMVVAKSPFAHHHLARQFEARTVHKEYLALVRGRVRRRMGEIDIPIGYHPKRWGLMSTDEKAKRRKPARSVYEVLERFGGYTLLSVVLKTGRTHQIRVHFESIGHPVVGERYYRGELGPDPLEEAMPRLALHAWKLGFVHPGTRARVDFAAELPDDFAAALEHLRGRQQETAGPSEA
ncbi:MAG: RluA family pseudouridine synthase [Candidatus Brocadiia bacterium]